MAGAATDYLENKILDYILGGVTFTVPSTLYIGLATSVNEEGTITGEPTTEVGYHRIALSNNLTTFPSASNGQKSNGVDIIFPTATGDWGTINYTFIADSDKDVVGGKVLLYSQLAVSKTTSSIVTGKQIGRAHV